MMRRQPRGGAASAEPGGAELLDDGRVDAGRNRQVEEHAAGAVDLRQPRGEPLIERGVVDVAADVVHPLGQRSRRPRPRRVDAGELPQAVAELRRGSPSSTAVSRATPMTENRAGRRCRATEPDRSPAAACAASDLPTRRRSRAWSDRASARGEGHPAGDWRASRAQIMIVGSLTRGSGSGLLQTTGFERIAAVSGIESEVRILMPIRALLPRRQVAGDRVELCGRQAIAERRHLGVRIDQLRIDDPACAASPASCFSPARVRSGPSVPPSPSIL